MARNVEIKARVHSIETMLTRALALADGEPEEIVQDDTFFACAHGRLKLRAFSADAGEVIHYERADTTGPKTSDYVRSATSSPDTLREALTRACGSIGRVRKRRLLLWTGQTRIHLDTVEGLGDFIELEVVLRDDQSAEDGVAIADALMRRLHIGPHQLVAGAYIDLLREPAA